MEKQNNMDVLPLFFYDFYYINNGRYNKIGTPRRRVFSTLSFILFIFFLVLAILSVIKKTGVAKNNLLLQPYYLSFLLRYQVFQILLLKKRQQLVQKLLLTMKNRKIAKRKKRRTKKLKSKKMRSV